MKGRGRSGEVKAKVPDGQEEVRGGVKRKPVDAVGAAEAVEEVGDVGPDLGRHRAVGIHKVVAGLPDEHGAHGGLQP